MVCAHRSCALFVSAPDFTPLRVMRRVMRQRLLCLAEHRGTLRTLGWLPAVVGALFPSSAPVRTAPTMGCFSSKDVSPEPEQEEVSWDGTIRPIRPWKLEPSLTSAQLERLRNEFWETRVEGRQEMWQALRFAAEADSVRCMLALVKPRYLEHLLRLCNLCSNGACIVLFNFLFFVMTGGAL